MTSRLAASASIARAARRHLGGLCLVVTTGAGPALLAISVTGWLLMFLAGDRGRASHVHATTADQLSLLRWLAMVAAMMPLLVADPIGHVWTRSLRRYRWRRILFFALGYVLVWTTAGWLLVSTAAGLITTLPGAAPPALAAAIVAAVWQAMPAKQACLNRCHALPPLHAFGFAADRHAIKYGVTAGVWCLGSCWPLMLVAAVIGGAHAAAMAAAMAVTLAERQAPCRPANWRFPFGRW